jgi:glycosyltransferase involved in cell wall biosynthesis
MPQRITVMHLISCFAIGGAEKLVIDLAASIDKTKFDVLLCGMDMIKNSVDETFYAGLRKQGIKILMLSKPPHRRRIETVLKLRRHLKDNNVSILHTHCQSPDFYGKISALLSRTPLVFSTIHNVAGYHAIHESVLHKLTTRYIAISETVKRYGVSELKIPSEKIEVIYNAIDTQKFSSSAVDKRAKLKELGIPAGRKIVTTVGSCEERKGHHYLIEAAEQITRKMTDVHFLFVGDTAADPEFVNLMREMLGAKKLQDRISFTGTRTDIAEILSVTDIFVLPSLYEGLSIALLEAMASGLPVIATSVGSNPEVVANGINGFIVPPKDPQLLAHKIEGLLADPAKAADMGSQGRRRVKEAFGIDRLVRQHEELYLKHFDQISSY